MKHYELLVIVKPTFTAEELAAKVDSIKELLEKNGSEVASVQKYGIRNLGYEIAKNKRGYYVVYYFKTQPSNIQEIERVQRFDEDLLRFLTIKYESKKEIANWENLVAGKKAEFTKKRARKEKKEDKKEG